MSTSNPTGREDRPAEQPGPFWETRRNLSASAKLVLTVLEWEGPLTRQDIERETRLASRTVYDALVRLTDQGIVDTRPNFQHAQRPYYSLAAVGG